MFTSRTNKPASPITRAIHATLDSLESRRMLANDPLTVTKLMVGTAPWINVVGTAGDDAIVVSKTGATTFVITNGSWSKTCTGAYVGVRVAAGGGNDTVTSTGAWALRTSLLGEAGNDTIVGGIGNDYVLAGIGDDSVTGNAGIDTLYGEAGDDVITGNAGADYLHGGAGNDNLDGGADNDNLNGIDGNDTLTGGLGNDLMNAGVGDDSLDGGDGNDNMLGVDGNDTLNGGLGNDSMVAGIGDDALNGNDGLDTLVGDAGNDTLLGGNGNDWLGGYAGDDSVDGGANDDKLVAATDTGNDLYVGGGGLDQVDYTGRVVGLTITLNDQADDGATGETDNVGTDIETIVGGNAADVITGDDNSRGLYGQAGNDTITGGGAADKIFGAAGDDSLTGGAGDDSIWGQDGNDRMLGGDDEDLLEGGLGNDVYDGGDDRDNLIAIGGGVLDSLTGGDGLDSFWLDTGTGEVITDIEASETTARAEHRVTAFVKYGATVISKEITSQKLADPVGTGKLINFRANKLFADSGPSMDDIAQGQVGDCWYLASLSAIAKVAPEQLRQAVTDLGDGTYAVRFFNPSNGAAQYVRVDADLYTYTWSATTQMYARSGSEGSIWAPILEKALTWVRGSKLGNYTTISSGWMNEANSRLGIVSANSSPQAQGSVNAMVSWMQTQLDANKALTFGTPGGVQAGVRLVGGHAYTVHDIVDNGDGTYGIVVRNPWASDGVGTDGTNDGYVTLTAAQLYANCSGLTAAAA
jgi:Ca2+-binding RTX toxin-like protein